MCALIRVLISGVEGQQLRYCGVGAGYDDVIIDGSTEEMKARIINRIIAVSIITRWFFAVRRVLRQARQRCRRGKVSLIAENERIIRRTIV